MISWKIVSWSGLLLMTIIVIVCLAVLKGQHAENNSKFPVETKPSVVADVTNIVTFYCIEGYVYGRMGSESPFPIYHFDHRLDYGVPKPCPLAKTIHFPESR